MVQAVKKRVRSPARLPQTRSGAAQLVSPVGSAFSYGRERRAVSSLIPDTVHRFVLIELVIYRYNGKNSFFLVEVDGTKTHKNIQDVI